MGHKCPSCKSGELFLLNDLMYKVEFYCPKCNKKVIAIRRELYDEIKGTTIFENFEENSRKKYL